MEFDALSYLASGLGQPLYLDAIMKERLRFEFARICIEISIAKSFPEVIHIKVSSGEMLELKVEYS